MVMLDLFSSMRRIVTMSRKDPTRANPSPGAASRAPRSRTTTRHADGGAHEHRSVSRRLIRRTILIAAAVLGFAGSANAATLTASWDAPTTTTLTPGTTADWKLTVTSDGATSGPATFTVSFGMTTGGHTSDPLAFRPITTSGSAGQMSCTPAGQTVSCSNVTFGSAGSHTLTIPVALPANYVPIVSGSFMPKNVTPGDTWGMTPLPKTATVTSGQSNLYGNGDMPSSANDHVASGSTITLPFTVMNRAPSGAADHVRIR